MQTYKLELKKEEIIALIRIIDGLDLTPNDEGLLAFISSKLKYELPGAKDEAKVE